MTDMKRCGSCANLNRGDPEIAKPGLGFCYAEVSEDDLAKVRAILPFACMSYGVTWRNEVMDADGDGCPKWKPRVEG